MKLTKIRKIILLCLSVFFSILVLALIFFHTQAAGAWLLDLVDRELRENHGFSLSAARVRPRPLALAFTLEEVVLTNLRPTASILQTFRAEKLEVNAAWSSVLGRELHLQKIRLLKPHFEIVAPGQSPEQTNNAFPENREITESGDQAGRPLKIRIDQFELLEGSLLFSESGGPVNISAFGIRAAIGYQPGDKSHSGRLEVAGGRISFNDHKLDISKAALQGRFRNGSFFIDEFSLASRDSRVEIKGSLKPFNAVPEFDLQLKALLNSAEIVHLAGRHLPLSGSFSISGRASGRGSELSYQGKMSGLDLATDLEPFSLESSFQGNKRSLEINSFILRSIGGEVRGDAVINLDENNLSRAEVSWEKIDLYSFSRLLPDSIPRLAASFAGRIEAEWSGTRGTNLRANGHLLLEPAGTAPRPADRQSISPRGRIDFKAGDGRFNVQADLSTPGVDLRLTGRQDELGLIDAQFTLTLNNLGQTAASFGLDSGDFLPEHSQPVIVQAKMSGTLEAPRLTAKLNMALIEWTDVRLEDLELKLAADRHGISLSSISGLLNGGSLIGTGRLLLDPQSLKPTKGSHFALEFRELGLQPLASRLPQLKQGATPGTISGGLHFSQAAVGWTTVFRATASFPPDAAMPLNRVELSGTFSEKELRLESINCRGDLGSMSGSFALAWKNRTFQVLLQGDDLSLNRLNWFSPGLAALKGRGDLLLEGRGSLENPEFNLTLVIEELAAGAFMIPLIELEAFSDSRRARATFSIPSLRLKSEAELVLEKPYLLTGKLALNRAELAAVMKDAQLRPAVGAEGELNLSLDWAYPLMKPDEFNLKGAFSVIDLALPGARVEPIPAIEALKGEFALAGNPADLQQLQAEMSIEKFDLGLAGLRVSMPRIARLNLHAGQLNLDKLVLKSTDSEVGLSGWLKLKPEPEIKAELSLQVALNLFDSLLPDALFGGRLVAAAEVSGSLSTPAIHGRAEFQDLFIRLRDFPLTLTGINAVLEFQEKETLISSFSGSANGGGLTISGRINHGNLKRIEAEKITVKLRNFNLSYPEGMATVADADLELNGPWNTLVLSGETRILRGIYRRNIHTGIELINLARYSPDFSPEDVPALLRHLRLQLTLNSSAPLRIRNNLADIDMEANLMITGTPAFPLFSGRIANSSVGRLLIGGRTYTVEKLILEYMGTEIRDFSIEVQAHTRLRYESEDFAIKLRLSGPMADPEYSLSYVPTTRYPNLSSQDLAFLLLTGKMPADLSGHALDTLGAQLLTHFASPFTSPLTEGLKKLLKAEDVTIEPLVIASEADPGARFTFRKRVSPRALFTYSADITRNQRHTWMLDYDLLSSLMIGAFRRDDGSYGASFKHSLQFPGTRSTHRTSASAAAEKQILTELSWTGQLIFPEKQLRAATRKLRTGRPFSYEDLYNAVEKTLNYYRRQGYANVTVTPNLTQINEDSLKVVIEVVPGSPAGFIFSGDPLPGSLKKGIQASWLGDFPEKANLEESRALIVRELKRRRYFNALVETSVEEKQGRTTYIFRVNRGQRYHIAGIDLAGGGPLSEKRLKRVLSTYLLAPTTNLWNLVVDENAALEALRRAYAELGHLQARVSALEIKPDPLQRSLAIRLEIDAGPQTLVNRISLAGNESLSDLELRSKLALLKGSPFNPIRLQEDRNTLLSAYRSRGFKNAEVSVTLSGPNEVNEIDLLFEIREGLRHKVAAIEVRGGHRTREKFIIREAGLKPGTPSTLENFSRAKKRLYDSGAFRTVNITALDADSAEPGDDTVLIEVEEAALLTLNYGLRYNTEEKIEGHGELNFNSIFGAGRKGFLSYRQSRLQRDFRFSMLAPYLFGVKLNTLFSLYDQKETRENLVTSTRGLSVQQQIRLPLDFFFSYLYRFNRIHTYELESWGPFPFDFTINLSEIGLVLLRDVRDDRLNPTAGSYFSASLTYAPKYLGSDLPYVSFFSQYTQARKIGKKLVWAASLRLGLANAFEGELIPGKRFFAGGGNSVRGFRLDSLGPRDPYIDRASGGMAVLIFNNELRLPLLGPLGVSVFHDCGNVWTVVSELDLGALRHGAGFGLRLDSPLGLLRLDLGFNLRPRPGEARTVLFFSLGQAF